MSHASSSGKRLELWHGYGAQRLFFLVPTFWLLGWVFEHDPCCSHNLCVHADWLSPLHCEAWCCSSNVDVNLRKVLDLLRNARANLPQEGHEGGDSEVPTVDPVVESKNESEEPEREWNRFERYQQSTMDEVSDDEFWRCVHHGPPTVDEHPRHHREYM